MDTKRYCSDEVRPYDTFNFALEFFSASEVAS